MTALPFAIHAMVQALYGGVAADLRDLLEAGGVGLRIVTAAFGVPGVLLQPMAGALVDRLGVRRTMTVATLGYGCCCARLVMSESVVSASAARLVMGACLVFRARWTWGGCCMRAHPVLRARRLGERAFDRCGGSRGAARVGRFSVGRGHRGRHAGRPGHAVWLHVDDVDSRLNCSWARDGVRDGDHRVRARRC
ncbi:MAG: MFS transporter [Planctomycetes bacterium]|nr:MFS transporter [Planctomycetota bacterium]